MLGILGRPASARALAEKVMSAYIPSRRGIIAVILALVGAMFVPAMTPARGAPVAQYVWVIGCLTSLLCISCSAIALLRKAPGDRIAGVAAGVLTLWMIYAFYNAVS
jgi:hypothetical protein